MMCAMKSLCEALEHIRGVHSGPECEMCKENYYFLNTRGAHRVDFGPRWRCDFTKGPQGIFRFPKGKLRFAGISMKITKVMTKNGRRPHDGRKRRLEMTVVLMRVVLSGPTCEMCRDFYYFLSTREVATEQHRSPMYPHESLKVQF